MSKRFSEFITIQIPVCKVPKKFDISIRICSENGGFVSCKATDNIKHNGIYKRWSFLEYSPRITTIFVILRNVIIDTFLMIRGK